jgi:hypothetical protein
VLSSVARIVGPGLGVTLGWGDGLVVETAVFHQLGYIEGDS